MSNKSEKIWNITNVTIAGLSLLVAVAAISFPEIRKCAGLDASLPDEMPSICPVTWADYEPLENALVAQDFGAADIETRRLLQKITGLTSNDPIDHRSQKVKDKLKCQHIQEIDRLWTKYSNNKFGFSVQNAIYQAKPSVEDFGENVGWKENGKWLTVSDLNPEIDARPGYLPSRAPGLPEYPDKQLNKGWMAWLVISSPFSGCLSSQ